MILDRHIYLLFLVDNLTNISKSSKFSKIVAQIIARLSGVTNYYLFFEYFWADKIQDAIKSRSSKELYHINILIVIV